MRKLAAPALALMVSACGQNDASAPRCAKLEQPTQVPVDAEGDVRLNVAMARIAQLQRENAELRASQDPVDAEMLRQEVASLKSALAMAAVANSPAPVEAATKPGKTETKSSGPRTATIPPKPASVAKPASPEAKRQPNRKPLTLDLR